MSRLRLPGQRGGAVMKRDEFVEKMEIVTTATDALGWDFAVPEDGDVNVVIIGTHAGIHSITGHTNPLPAFAHFTRSAKH